MSAGVAEELERAAAVRPQWTRVVSAADALGLEPRTLLHAGPPFEDGAAPSPPILNAASLCAVHEGWAPDLATACRMVLAADVRLQPAQDRGALAPLAAVISPRSTLIEVQDAASSARRCWSLLPSGPGPDIRFGSSDPAILERLAFRDEWLAPLLGSILEQPLDLDAMAAAGLGAGDDLHGSTAGATRALGRALLARLDPERAEARELREVLDASPLFFLTFWMAACRLVAASTEGVRGSRWVTRLAGNGHRVGMTVAGAPGQWICMPASAPAGPRLPHVDPAIAACGVIGDSAIIDVSGFGGSALARAEPTRQALGAFVPIDAERAAGLLVHPHPRFREFGVRIGLDAIDVVRSRVSPVVVIGMIDGSGEKGLLGRGVYRPPIDLFEAASRAPD